MGPAVRVGLVVVGFALVAFAVGEWDANEPGRAEPGRSDPLRLTTLLRDGPAAPALVGTVFVAVGAWPRRRKAAAS